MPRTVAIGNQNFEELIKRNCFYIDKTGFIVEWWNSVDQVSLIARPRRFGKTLNMNMMDRFFSTRYKDDSFNPFEHLSVWENNELREQYCGHPVIFLSFAGIKSSDFDRMKISMSKIINELILDYIFVFRSNRIDEAEKAFFHTVSDNMKEEDLVTSLRKLSRVLNLYYGKEVIILLDEYDTPLQEAWINGYWDDAVGFIRELFNNTFKTNPYMYRAVMTGITRVSKESIFSDLNNLKLATLSSDKYASMFGFTQAEVDAALEEYDIDERDRVQYWYDGFTIGNHTDIYNPWSIINFLSERKFSAYWANTSSNSLVSSLLRKGDKTIFEQFETLLGGDSIQAIVTDELVFNQLDEDDNAIWSLLLCSGYLKTLSPADEDGLAELTITNYETRSMFRSMVKGWFSRANSARSQFIRYLQNGNVEMMNEYLSDITENVFSYYDVGNGKKWKKYENFYHGFALGLMVELSSDYIITSNRESGLGRYDVCMRKKDLSAGIVLEFKAVREDEGETLESAVKAALDQIIEKDYTRELVTLGIPGECIKRYGMAFMGKEVLVQEI